MQLGTTATITIIDNDLPAIDIVNAEPTYSGNNAVFTLNADKLPSGPVEINFRPRESGSNFLSNSR